MPGPMCGRAKTTPSDDGTGTFRRRTRFLASRAMATRSFRSKIRPPAPDLRWQHVVVEIGNGGSHSRAALPAHRAGTALFYVSDARSLLILPCLTQVRRRFCPRSAAVFL